MTKAKPLWQPPYSTTPAIVRRLLEIEAVRTAVGMMALPPAVEVKLRHQARLHATHYSTRIEGNRLTLDEAEQVIQGRQVVFPGRERDILEVKNYWNALLKVEEWAAQKRSLSEDLIHRLHALVEEGPRAKPIPYRQGQNVIRDSASGAMVYMPPEAADVPGLMAELVNWVQWAESSRIAIPLIAGLLHYQFVTIHPYYDGNGRTTRLLATFILHRGGYGLQGLFSLEKFHARDPETYYRALTVHPHHNYYEGRAAADLTVWIEYFLSILSGVFTEVKQSAERSAQEGKTVEPEHIRRLDRRARIVLSLFTGREKITSIQAAQALGLSARMARVLIQGWVDAGLLVMAAEAKRNRAYGLTAIYRQYLDGLTVIGARSGDTIRISSGNTVMSPTHPTEKG